MTDHFFGGTCFSNVICVTEKKEERTLKIRQRNTMKQQQTDFEVGHRVMTPAGAAEIVEVNGDTIVVKLDNGEKHSFPREKVSDDSDAG